MEPVLVIHGGAGSHALVSEDGISKEMILTGIKCSLRRGYNILRSGGSAVSAVEEAVVAMEDDGIFNAGRGSCLTSEGNIEMDASIMDGKDFRMGGVICVQNIKNPIKLSRLVMEKSDHCLFVDKGAQQFAQKVGMDLVTTEDLMTTKSMKRLERTGVYVSQVRSEFDKEKLIKSESEHDTVGAVAIDKHGNVAYATSTGGITAKKPGRCGDSASPGCGGYANNEIGAVSTTGHGESLLKTCLANYAMSLMQAGKSPQEAMEASMDYLCKRVDGYGGIIAVSRNRDVGIAFNTTGMSWGYVKDGELHYGLFHNEDTVESL